MEQNSKTGGKKDSVTPSTRLLNQKRYLACTPDAATVRNRIAAAEQTGNCP
jgi:hypothetical protein